MEGLRFIGVSICITTVVTSIFSMLTPDTKLDKVLKFAISLFFLTSLVSPFVGNKLDFHVDIEDVIDNTQTQTMTQSVQNQFLELSKTKICNIAEKALIKENISPQKVDVLINITEDNCISIKTMMVYIDEKDKEKTEIIKSTVLKAVGFTPEIEVKK